MLLEAGRARILGLDVLCGDGRNRFLPFATVRHADGGIEIDSSLTLLDGPELDFYRSRGRTLTAAPELGDAFVGADGALVGALAARC